MEHSERIMRSSRLRRRTEPAVSPATVYELPPNVRIPVLIGLAACGVFLSGWFVSRLPVKHAATVAIDRSYSDATEAIAVSPDELLHDVFHPSVIQRFQECICPVESCSAADLLEQARVSASVRLAQSRPGSDRVFLRLIAGSAQQAKARIDELAKAYVEYKTQSARRPDAAMAIRDLQHAARLDQQERDSLQKQIEELDRAAPESIETIELRMAEVRDHLDRAEAEIRQSESKPTPVEETRPAIPTTPALAHPARSRDASLVQAALSQCVEYRNRLAVHLSADHPAVVGLNRKIDALLRQSGVELDAAELDLLAASTPPNEPSLDLEEIRAAVARLREEYDGFASRRDESLRWQSEKRKLTEELRAAQARADQTRQSLEQAIAAERRADELAVHHAICPEHGIVVEDLSLNRRFWFLLGAALSLGVAVTIGYLTTPKK